MKPGRNDRCPCGSGKKFKHCCEGKALLQVAAPSPTEFSQLVALYNTGRHAELESRARSMLEKYPNSGDVWKILSAAQQTQGKEALPVFQKTAELLPDDADAHYNLGVVLQNLEQLELAAASYQCALKIKPGHAETHNNLGVVLKDLGQLDDAVASYRRALEIKPDFSIAHSNLLFILNYDATCSPSAYLAEARQYGRMVDSKVTAQFTAWRCIADPKRLRVGMVSGDLRQHSVGHFLEGLLAAIDPHRIELIAYPTQRMEDALTARIKPHFSAWRPLFDLNDKSASQLIHADRVHVLIDMSGHSTHNRLPVFAWKPAPVQATWLGYFSSTGVAEMDYILGDKWTLPDGEESHFVEKGWRLENILWCMTSPKEDIKIDKLPAARNQSITFGSLNNLAKMNNRVVACWAHILNAIPGSSLYLNTGNLRDDTLRKNIFARYSEHGIPENRLILEATTGRAAALNSYNRIDIALDTFPYPGGTTSYEALWMGVPVLTMRGNNYISHLGESILHNAGLADWIAVDAEDYVAKALFHTSNLERLANLRTGLRQQVLTSPLFDAPRFSRNFEEALWGMWREKT